jgi:hypothetical protein
MVLHAEGERGYHHRDHRPAWCPRRIGQLASRVVSGQRLRASQGKRIGGTVYGYDRELYDDQGNMVRRVSFREKFRKPATWTSVLVPSDETEAVDGVQWMFHAVHDGHSVGHVVRGLNDRGLTTAAGKPFTYNSVLSMLRNHAYAGTLVVGNRGFNFNRYANGEDRRDRASRAIR